MATVIINTDTDDHVSEVDASERAIVLRAPKKGLALPTIPAEIEIGDIGSGGILPSVHVKGQDDGLYLVLELIDAIQAFGPKYFDPAHELIRAGHFVKLRQAMQAASASRCAVLDTPDVGVSFQQLATASVLLLQCANIVCPTSSVTVSTFQIYR
jgi:hypothetical protein